MGGSDAPDVRVENQLVRFTHSTPIDQEMVVDKLGGVRSGRFVLLQMESPSATIVIDEVGRIVVHGTKRIEVARGAAKEILLRLNRDDAGLSTELGPILASFQYARPLTFEGIERAVAPAIIRKDERLDCMRLKDDRHGIDLLMWSNGKAVALGARHPNLVAMAAVYWRGKIDSAGLFAEG